MPSSPAALAAWALNLKTQLPVYNAILNIPANTLAAINTILDGMISGQGNIDTLQLQLHQLISERNNFTENNTPAMKKFLEWIETQPGYNTTMGEAMGIIRPTRIQEVTGWQPTLKYKIDGNRIYLNFIKHGADGINIYWRFFGETVFKLLANAKTSPYIAAIPGLTAGTTVQLELYCMLTYKNEEVGVKSDVISIRYTP